MAALVANLIAHYCFTSFTRKEFKMPASRSCQRSRGFFDPMPGNLPPKKITLRIMKLLYVGISHPICRAICNLGHPLNESFQPGLDLSPVNRAESENSALNYWPCLNVVPCSDLFIGMNVFVITWEILNPSISWNPVVNSAGFNLLSPLGPFPNTE